MCKKDLSSCSQESYFQYSQTRPHFIQNNKKNQINLSHVVLHSHLTWNLLAQNTEIYQKMKFSYQISNILNKTCQSSF